jgi:uncharacterized protein (DUF111 family)
MKKSRPGTLICALCPEAAREAVVEAMLRHTTTIGIRESLCRRGGGSDGNRIKSTCSTLFLELAHTSA